MASYVENVSIWWRHHGVTMPETIHDNRTCNDVNTFYIIGLFECNSPVIGGLPSQRASNAEIWYVLWCLLKQPTERRPLSWHGNAFASLGLFMVTRSPVYNVFSLQRPSDADMFVVVLMLWGKRPSWGWFEKPWCLCEVTIIFTYHILAWYEKAYSFTFQ